MVLDSPEWFRGVLETHDDPAILFIFRPSKLLNLPRRRDRDVERVVSDCIGFSYSLEDVGSLVVYMGDETMLDGTEAPEVRSEFDSEALQPEAHAEDGEEIIILQVPKILDYADIGWVVWRAGSGPYHNG